MQEVYLLLGSNRGDRENNLLTACRKVSGRIGKIGLISSMYETEPWGFTDDTLFYNQALMVNTMLSPHDLLAEIHKMESETGRVRDSQASAGDSCACSEGAYTSRILDIDILLYGQLILFTDELMIPHPRMHTRRFVLVPLNEIAARLVHPVLKKTVAELLMACNDSSTVQLLNNK
jgi:2-amino-4-hydroxy-6-hydroxymethyldihydropteridine diphosphokinase